MKVLLILSAFYVGIEFADYLTGIISHLIIGDYTSHNAKIGALKKLALTVLVCALPIFAQLLNIVGKKYSIEIPGEILVFGAMYQVKAIATEFSSVVENLLLMEETNSGSI